MPSLLRDSDGSASRRSRSARRRTGLRSGLRKSRLLQDQRAFPPGALPASGAASLSRSNREGARSPRESTRPERCDSELRELPREAGAPARSRCPAMRASRSACSHWESGPLLFPEAVSDDSRKRVDRSLLVGTFGANENARSAFSGKHHDTHDALAVHLEIIADDRDVALELRGTLHDLGSGTRVNAELVNYLHAAFDH